MSALNWAPAIKTAVPGWCWRWQRFTIRHVALYTLKTTREILSIHCTAGEFNKLKCKIKCRYQGTLKLNCSLWANQTRPDRTWPAVPVNFLSQPDPTRPDPRVGSRVVKLCSEWRRAVDTGATSSVPAWRRSPTGPVTVVLQLLLAEWLVRWLRKFVVQLRTVKNIRPNKHPTKSELTCTP